MFQQQLLDARAAGKINAAAAISGGGDLVEDAGQPKWKWNAALNWDYGPFAAGVSAQYVGRVFQKTVVNTANEFFEVEDQLTGNAYAQYEFNGNGLSDTTVRVGVRNFTNENPPIARAGYLGNLYQPYARYWYASVRKSF
jgi:hypothetical protein